MTPLKPIFETIFAPHWAQLPAVMHKHYASRPFTQDCVVCEGTMDVEMARLIRLFSPFLRIMGLLAPYPARHIPATVRFRSCEKDNGFRLERLFHYPSDKPLPFFSRMIPYTKNEVIEVLSGGIGWHCRFEWDGHKISLHHIRYTLSLFGYHITLPIAFLVGKGYAEEEALDDTRFMMRMTIRHPLFKQLYAYQGTFTITEVRYAL